MTTVTETVPRYELIEATSFDNPHLTEDFLEDLRELERENPPKYRRLVMNSWDDPEIEGAYYLRWMHTARDEGRVTTNLFDPNVLVHTVCDLGYEDDTAFWWFQVKGQRVNLVHYYSAHHEAIAHYAGVIDQVGKKRQMIYGQHFAPFDVSKHELGTGKTVHDWAREAGLVFTKLPFETRVFNGIERVRRNMHRFWWDETYCQDGIDAVESYRKQKVESRSQPDKPVFTNHPVRDWCTHPCDSLRYMTMALEKMTGQTSNKKEIEALSRRYVMQWT